MRFFLTALVCLLLVNVVSSLNKERDCKCRIQSTRRIIGGREADHKSLPWQVTYQWKDRHPLPDHLRRLYPDSRKTRFHSCGGTIINQRFILTAAHCVDDKDAGTRNISAWQIGYGENDLAKIYDRNQYKQIATFHKHADYSRRNNRNDIALIELKSPLMFSDSVQPACLGFDEKELYDDGTLKISGWGSLEPIDWNIETDERSKSVIPRMLQETEVQEYSIKDSWCKDRKQNICLKDEIKGSTACSGDSGGPLHYTKNGKSQVIGVASFVDTIGAPSPNRKMCAGKVAYARLSTFKNWVLNIIGQEYCS